MDALAQARRRGAALAMETLERYGEAAPVSWQGLDLICALRGVAVRIVGDYYPQLRRAELRLSQPGIYVRTSRRAVIFLNTESEEVFAHELAHDLLAGEEPYRVAGYGGTDPETEATCNAFAAVLLGQRLD